MLVLLKIITNCIENEKNLEFIKELFSISMFEVKYRDNTEFFQILIIDL